VTFTGVIDNQPFMVLGYRERLDKPHELARQKQVVWIARAAGAAALHNVQVCNGERLIDQKAPRRERVSQSREKRTIEEAHANDGADRARGHGQGTNVGCDGKYSTIALDGASDRVRDEIHHDDGATGFGKRRGVAPTPSRHVEEKCLGGQRKAAFYDPGRRRAVSLTPALDVPGLPVGTIVPRTELLGHR
jgi:hypothetical protein